MNDKNKNAIIIILVIALIVVVAFSSVMACMYYMETQQKEIISSTTNSKPVTTSQVKKSPTPSPIKEITSQKALENAVQYAEQDYEHVISYGYIVDESKIVAENDEKYLVALGLAQDEFGNGGYGYYTVDKINGVVEYRFDMQDDWTCYPHIFGDFLVSNGDSTYSPHWN